MYTCPRCSRMFNRKQDLLLHRKYCDLVPGWILELDDDHKLKQRYSNKKVNAVKENITCELTYEDFCKLVKEANLKSSDLGFSSVKKYVLARFNDTGNYAVRNCRFITQIENSEEKKISEKSRKQSSLNMKKYNASIDRSKGSEEYKRWLEKFYLSDYMESLRSKPRKVIPTDPRYSGEKNSQFGTFWITNGSQNSKWSQTKGPIPEGYYKGRVINHIG